MSVTIKTTIKNPKKFNRMQVLSKTASSKNVEVGVLSDKMLDNGLTLDFLAKIHEFGLGAVPERSFIRNFFTENRTKIGRIVTKERKKVALFLQTEDEALEKIGAELVVIMKKRLLFGIQPTLKQTTVDRKLAKGYTKPFTPLYATGELYDNIQYKVNK